MAKKDYKVTSVKIEKDLHRQAKAEAPKRGQFLHDLVNEGLRAVLGQLGKEAEIQSTTTQDTAI